MGKERILPWRNQKRKKWFYLGEKVEKNKCFTLRKKKKGFYCGEIKKEKCFVSEKNKIRSTLPWGKIKI